MICESNYFNTLLQGTTINLNAQQLARYQVTKQEENSRINVDKLEISKLEKELSQNQIQQRNANSRLITETDILNQIQPLAKEGAIAEVQLKR